MMIFKIAIRNIFRHKARSIITLSTIVFGCVALIFVGGFFADLLTQFREGFIGSQSAHIQIYRRGFNENGRVDPYKYLIENPETIRSLVQSIPDVEFVTARLQFSGLMSTGDNTVSFLGQGVEPANEKCVPLADSTNLRRMMIKEYSGLPVIYAGENLKEDDFYQVVLGRGLAETMATQVGTPVVLLTSTTAGATNALDVNVKGMFYTSAKDFDDVFLRVPLKTAQNLLNTPSVQSLVVKLHNTDDTDKVYKIIERMITSKHLDLELRRWEDLADNYNKTAKLFNMFYLILRIVIGTVVVLGIFNTMNMSVLERISEIGTIMALGTRRSGVLKQFLVEGLVLGFIGGAIGVLAGIVVVGVFSVIGIEMPPPPGGTFNWLATPLIVPTILVSTFILSILIGGISSLFPAFKASRLEITEALRYR